MTNPFVKLNLTGLDGVLNLLKSLPPELVSKRGGPVLAALRRGALVIRNQARANFAVAVAQPGLTGITDTTGFTEKQIVIKRRNPPTGVNGEKLVITVNPKPHPGGRLYKRKSRAVEGKRKTKGPTARAIRANDIAFIMEVGTSKQPATPWLRPAFQAKAEESIRTIESELVKGVDRVVKKLASQNKGR